MLTKLKTLFSMSCISILFCSCGKEVSNSSDDKNTTSRPTLGSSIVPVQVSMDTDQNQIATNNFQAKDSGWILIPSEEALRVSNGDSATINSKLIFNRANSQSSFNDPEIYCEYLSSRLQKENAQETQDGYDHYFKGCFVVLEDGPAEVNYLPGQEIALDEGHFVKVEVNATESESTLEISYDIEVDWR